MAKLAAGRCLVLLVALCVGQRAMALTETEVVAKVNCKQSDEALSTVCDLYGMNSDACSVSTKAHEKAGCSLGEGAEDAPSEMTGCGTGNNQNAKGITDAVCNAAKRLCNIKTKDYCTTAAHVDCMQSIGAMCKGVKMTKKDGLAKQAAEKNPDAPPVVDEASTPLHSSEPAAETAEPNEVSTATGAAADSTATGAAAGSAANASTGNTTSTPAAAPTQSPAEAGKSIDEDIATGDGKSSNGTKNEIANAVNSDVPNPGVGRELEEGVETI